MSSLTRSLIIFGLVLFPAVSVLAGAQHFGARLDQAQWEASGSRLRCTLSHQIPFYGTARFESRSGGSLEFVLEVLRQPARPATAQLSSVAPAWMHDVAPTELGEVEIAQDRVAFRFHRTMARRLLSELEKGMYPTLRYADWSDGRDQVTVALSAVKLQAALGNFLNCINDLLPYDFDAVRETHVHFAFDSASLDDRSKAALDRVAAYLSADPKVSQVRLVGYTDNVGFRRYNERLSRRRSDAVRDYLRTRGAKSAKFVVVAHGETRPLASNRNELGRSENRRVVVILVK